MDSLKKLFKVIKYFNLNLSPYLIYASFYLIEKNIVSNYLLNIYNFLNNKKFNMDTLKDELENFKNKIKKIAYHNKESDKNIQDYVMNVIKNQSFIKIFDEIGLDLEYLKTQVEQKIKEINGEIKILYELNLPTIEEFLKKNNTNFNVPKLFRPQGPLWIDFEEGYVYKPPILDEIIKKIENENLIVFKGDPVSGKSTLIKYIGYELSKKLWNVYYLDLKTFQKQKLLDLENLRNLKHGLIIVDDAHLDLNLIESFLRSKPNIKLLISCRKINIEGTKISGSPNIFLKILKNSIEIKAIDYADELIKIFEEKRNIKINENMKKELSKNNLWSLIYQLETYEKHNNLEEVNINKTIYSQIEATYNKTFENALLPLSIFYSFEIPIIKTYLEKFFQKEDIDELEKFNEIALISKDNKEYLSLNNSEVAKIFLKAFKNQSDLGILIKNYVDKEIDNYKIDKTSEYKYELFFLIDYIVNFHDVFKNWVFLIDDIKLIEELNRISKDFLEEKLKELNNSDEICSLLATLVKIGYSKLNEIDISIFKEKIRKWEDLWSISNLLETLYEINYSGLDKLINNLGVDLFETKIRKCEELDYIYLILETLNNIGYSKLNEIDNFIFEEKIRKLEDLWDISNLLETLYEVNYSGFEVLMEVLLEPQLFEEKIKLCDETESICLFLETLNNIVYNDLAESILEKLGVEFFEEKIRKLDEPKDICLVLETLDNIEYYSLGELIEKKLGVEFFEEKIRKLDELNDICLIIETLNNISFYELEESIEKKLGVEFFEEKVRKSNLNDIFWFLDFSSFEELIAIDLEVEFFEKKLKELYDMKDMCRILNKIDLCDDPKDFIYIFDEKLASNNLSFINLFLDTLYDRSKDLIRKMFDIEFLNEKIRAWYDIKDICRFLNTLDEVNYTNLDELIEKLGIEFFEDKIRKWDEAEYICLILKTLDNIGYLGMKILIERFEINFWEDKLREGDLEDIYFLLKTFYVIDYNKLKTLIEMFETKFWKEKLTKGDLKDIYSLLNLLQEMEYSKLEELIKNFEIDFFLKLIEFLYLINKKVEVKNLIKILIESNYPDINELRKGLKEKNLWFIEEN